MVAPYWGQLPPPQVIRGNSMKCEKLPNRRGSNGLSVDTNMRGDRLSSQSQQRPNRFSTQTDAPTLSTQSPFASPVASEFRGDGLAPRPPSFPYGASQPAYNNDFTERRRRRQSRDKDQYYEPAAVPPPAAPDAPRPPPPVSYKQPFSNVPRPSNSQEPVRSISSRKAESPISPNKGPPEDYYRSHRRESYPVEGEQVRRPSNGKAVVRDRGDDQYRERQERGDSTRSQRPRKASVVSEAEAQRRREWAPDRSPLQRLELTLDGITKEEKRARVEEAELLAREVKAGRGGERAKQNSVRFRNRPVAKAPETVAEPQSLPEAGLVQSLSNKQKDQLHRSGTVERQRPVESEGTSSRGFEYKPGQDTITTSRAPETSIPQRRPSTRERSYIPVATGVTRSTSNKLKKEPPGDPWYNRRTEAERRYQEVEPRRPSTNEQLLDSHREATGDPGPSRGTAFRSHPQVNTEKELPLSPPPGRQGTRGHLDDLDSISDEDLDVQKPVRRGTLSKIERLTGQRAPPEVPRPIQSEDEIDTKPVRRGTLSKIQRLTGTGPRTPPQTVKYAQSRPLERQDVRTELVTVNGIKYAVPPNAAATRDSPHHTPGEGHGRNRRLHLTDVLHRHENVPGQGVYMPSSRLDEWKKGGVALLAGPLLDLDVIEPTEAEKDEAWWEAGDTGKRRRSSTKQRKAEAYDGEYDDTSGMVSQVSPTLDCQGCISEQRDPGKTRLPQRNISALQNAGYDQNSSPFSSPESIYKPHSLTCPMRGLRVRPGLAPTRFKPPLFLKSGPLLRYCGTRRERLQIRSTRNPVMPEREIWRGSVMIVTQDSQSSYELAPTLRLFLQPVDLLPPPPDQVDGEAGELAPEYIDPLAGLPKVGRDGRTLYIRPVDHLEEAKDLSREESDEGLFEMHRSPLDGVTDKKPACQKPHYDGEKAGKYKEVRGFRLHTEQGFTFWRFNLEIELREKQQRIAYRINRGPATGFWVPGKGRAMNVMFHSCNGFSHSVDPNLFSGPDPMWRDVLNTHQTQPFHVMLGGGDQIYNDAVMDETTLFKEWLDMKDPIHKERVPFTPEMQNELEAFYLNRYSMWFSQGLFGLAISQIPMINMFDDHDIIDGFGSYPDHYMKSPVMSGLGAVAFKYYMLFQHQSSIDEGEETEPSWILGTQPGPYIHELSRSVFTNLGRSVAFLGLDCRTERMNDEVVSAETYHKVFDRLEKDIIKDETKHLIVLVGVPVAYPRMVWLENILTSRAMGPLKALGRAGLLGKGLLNKFDGGVEVLDDLDDHWTAKHHKEERNWFIQELQDLAAEKSVRVTILGGDVHLGAIGQFYSNPKLGIPKDRDHRYMPNIISSAIVNTPPPNALADVLNRRNKVHHLDHETDEDMIPIFTHDVNGKPRNNKRLLNRRNWCSIRSYDPGLSPPPTPQTDGSPSPPPTRAGIFRSFSTRGPSYRPDAAAPPLSNPGLFNKRPSTSRRISVDSQRPGMLTRTLSLTRKDFMPANLFRRNSKRRDSGGINGYGSETDEEYYSDERSGIRGGSGGREDSDGYFPSMPPASGRTAEPHVEEAPISIAGSQPQQGFVRSQFHRTPTGLSEKQIRKGGNVEINLEGGLDICLNVEVSQKDPAGITMPYRLLVPALWYNETESGTSSSSRPSSKGGTKAWMNFGKGKRREREAMSP